MIVEHLKKDYYAYAMHLELQSLPRVVRPVHLVFRSTFIVVVCLRWSNSRLAGFGHIGRAMYRVARIISGIQIARSTKIGGGLLIPHYGTIVVNRRVEIGEWCTLLHNTTIGAKGISSDLDVPKIGNGVYIGAGSQVLGGIKVADGAVIGAGSVVVKDVPGNSVVAGNPAKVVRSRV
jgi:serine acetyltransferase